MQLLKFSAIFYSCLGTVLLLEISQMQYHFWFKDKLHENWVIDTIDNSHMITCVKNCQKNPDCGGMALGPLDEGQEGHSRPCLLLANVDESECDADYDCARDGFQVYLKEKRPTTTTTTTTTTTKPKSTTETTITSTATKIPATTTTTAKPTSKVEETITTTAEATQASTTITTLTAGETKTTTTIMPTKTSIEEETSTTKTEIPTTTTTIAPPTTTKAQTTTAESRITTTSEAPTTTTEAPTTTTTEAPTTTITEAPTATETEAPSTTTTRKASTTTTTKATTTTTTEAPTTITTEVPITTTTEAPSTTTTEGTTTAVSTTTESEDPGECPSPPANITCEEPKLQHSSYGLISNAPLFTDASLKTQCDKYLTEIFENTFNKEAKRPFSGLFKCEENEAMTGFEICFVIDLIYVAPHCTSLVSGYKLDTDTDNIKQASNSPESPDKATCPDKMAQITLQLEKKGDFIAVHITCAKIVKV